MASEKKAVRNWIAGGSILGGARRGGDLIEAHEIPIAGQCCHKFKAEKMKSSFNLQRRARRFAMVRVPMGAGHRAVDIDPQAAIVR